MQTFETSQPVAPAIKSLASWLKEIGRSDTTGWRWVKAGWIHPINIAGRPYLTAEDIQQFVERAAAGEFSAPPKGAARKSAEARAAAWAATEESK